ncbi:MAG: hypothetical protein N4A38_02020 [Candidatus Gracilibacteria bacterium]|nr:hypothetical protein [Candidatus Gracilibacteria bacterium]
MQNLDLIKLFGSKCRAKILEKFFLDYASANDVNYHMRALSRELEEQINSIKRELDNLENLGLLTSYSENKKKFFVLNKNFALMDEFKNIFLKTYDPLQNLVKFFEAREGLDLVLINSSLSKRLFEKSNNIVDIFLIGELEKEDFNDYLAKIFFNKKIKYAVINKDDFHTRIEYNDKLIFDILNQEKNMILRDAIGVEKYLN